MADGRTHHHSAADQFPHLGAHQDIRRSTDSRRNTGRHGPMIQYAVVLTRYLCDFFAHSRRRLCSHPNNGYAPSNAGAMQFAAGYPADQISPQGSDFLGLPDHPSEDQGPFELNTPGLPNRQINSELCYEQHDYDTFNRDVQLDLMNVSQTYSASQGQGQVEGWEDPYSSQNNMTGADYSYGIQQDGHHGEQVLHSGAEEVDELDSSPRAHVFPTVGTDQSASAGRFTAGSFITSSDDCRPGAGRDDSESDFRPSASPSPHRPTSNRELRKGNGRSIGSVSTASKRAFVHFDVVQRSPSARGPSAPPEFSPERGPIQNQNPPTPQDSRSSTPLRERAESAPPDTPLRHTNEHIEGEGIQGPNGVHRGTHEAEEERNDHDNHDDHDDHEERDVRELGSVMSKKGRRSNATNDAIKRLQENVLSALKAGSAELGIDFAILARTVMNAVMPTKTQLEPNYFNIFQSMVAYEGKHEEEANVAYSHSEIGEMWATFKNDHPNNYREILDAYRNVSIADKGETTVKARKQQFRLQTEKLERTVSLHPFI